MSEADVQGMQGEGEVQQRRSGQGQVPLGSRSRSHRSERSRSRSRQEKKQKHKHKHKHRSKSKDKKRRSRSKDEKKKKDKHKHKHKDRSRSKDKDRKKDKRRSREDGQRDRHRSKEVTEKKEPSQPTQVPMPLEVPMPQIPEERRRRERSRSPLNYYRKHQNSSNDGQFWDSFTWVPRMNYTPTVSAGALQTTKKMRRLQVTNVPFQIGITEEDFKALLTSYMTKNYLKDNMNNCPIVDLELNEADRSVAVELSSVEETCRVCKLEKIELFKGIVNGIIRLGDSQYGSNILTQAQNAAQAQAAAFAAINVLKNKKTDFTLDTTKKVGDEHSNLLRVVNAVTTYMANNLSKEEWDEYEEDLLEGFSQFGKVTHHWFVNTNDKAIVADPGNLFVEFERRDHAEKAMEEMQDRMYDSRAIKVYYFPRELYYSNFRSDVTPATVIEKVEKKKKKNQEKAAEKVEEPDKVDQ